MSASSYCRMEPLFPTATRSRAKRRREEGVPDYAAFCAGRPFSPAPRGLRRLPALGLRNATSGAPSSLCSAATFSATRLGIASTIPATPQIPAAKPQSQKDNDRAQFKSLSHEERFDDLALDSRKSEVSACDAQNTFNVGDG